MLVATPGATDANSYATVEEADAYHATRPHSEVWEDADDSEKEVALIHATRMLDALVVWAGSAVEPDIQALAWPRVGMVNRAGGLIPEDEIPIQLKEATAELARRLITTDVFAGSTSSSSNISKLKAGPVEISYRDDVVVSTTAIPDPVLALLLPSWYVTEEEAVKPTILFEAF